MTPKWYRVIRGRRDLLYDPKGQLDLYLDLDLELWYDPKGHGVIRGRDDLLYDPKGHGDICVLFDLVYDPKRSRGH